MGILLIKVRAAKEEGLGTLFKQAATQHTLWIYPVYMVLVFWWDFAYVSGCDQVGSYC